MNPNTFTTPISLDEGNQSSGKGSVSPKKLKKPKIISGYTRLSGRTIESDSFSEDIYEGTQESIPSFQELIEQAVIDRTALSTENTPEITLKTKYTKHDTKQIKASVITKTRDLTTPYNYEQEVRISLSEEGEKQQKKTREIQAQDPQVRLQETGQKLKQAVEKEQEIIVSQGQNINGQTQQSGKENVSKNEWNGAGDFDLQGIEEDTKWVYRGEVMNGLPNGEGEMIRFTQDQQIAMRYIGTFKEGIFHGKGKRVYYDGNNSTIHTEYVGDFFDGKMCGQGTLLWPGYQLKYVGGFNDREKYEGPGELFEFRSDGTLYRKLTGFFLDGEISGKGNMKEYYPIGKISSNYIGGFDHRGHKSGSREGEGEYTKYDIDEGMVMERHIGGFKNDKYHGNGENVKYCSDGSLSQIESGEFQKGELKGRGKSQHYSGGILQYQIEGDFFLEYNYKIVGVMTRYDSSQNIVSRYSGDIRYTVPHGTGELIEYGNKGEIVKITKGNWDHGKLVLFEAEKTEKETTEETSKSKPTNTAAGSRKAKWITGGLVAATLTTTGAIGLMQKGKKKDVVSGRTADIVVIENSAQKAVEVKKVSRHTAPESDPTVQYLKQLEEKYKDNPVELAKVMAIKVHPEYIEIAGLRLKRKNEFTSTNEAIGVYNKNGNTYYAWDTAVGTRGGQGLFYGKVPSLDQWEKMFHAIPGKSGKVFNNNMARILNIPYAGFYSSNGLVVGDHASIWSSTEGGLTDAYSIYFGNDEVIISFSPVDRKDARSIRLLYTGPEDASRGSQVVDQSANANASPAAGPTRASVLPGGRVILPPAPVAPQETPRAPRASVLPGGIVLPAPRTAPQSTRTVEAPRPYRHTVPESDPVVQYLKKLEVRYKNNPKEFTKVMAIRIHAQSIEFLSIGVKLKRKNESVSAINNKGIYHWLGDVTYFTGDAARKLYGNKMPSIEQWNNIFNSIPGGKPGGKKLNEGYMENIYNILELFGTTGGHMQSPDFKLWNPENHHFFWSSSMDQSNNMKYMCLVRNFYVTDDEKDFSNAYSVRLLAD